MKTCMFTGKPIIPLKDIEEYVIYFDEDSATLQRKVYFNQAAAEKDKRHAVKVHEFSCKPSEAHDYFVKIRSELIRSF